MVASHVCIAVGALQVFDFTEGGSLQLLRDIPRSRTEWIVWMDMDVIIDRMDFKIPLSKYDGKDFVIWGREDAMIQGDPLNGELPQPQNFYPDKAV